MEVFDKDPFDPLQQAAEAKAFQAKHRMFSPAVGKVREVKPDPDVPQDQPQSEKQQSQFRTSRTGPDARLVKLTVTRFDAESLAVLLWADENLCDW